MIDLNNSEAASFQGGSITSTQTVRIVSHRGRTEWWVTIGGRTRHGTGNANFREVHSAPGVHATNVVSITSISAGHPHGSDD